MTETYTIGDITLSAQKTINRGTIADGIMLNKYVFLPLSANDVALASAICSSYDNSVHYTQQNKTTAEQTQARKNISAASVEEITHVYKDNVNSSNKIDDLIFKAQQNNTVANVSAKIKSNTYNFGSTVPKPNSVDEGKILKTTSNRCNELGRLR